MRARSDYETKSVYDVKVPKNVHHNETDILNEGVWLKERDPDPRGDCAGFLERPPCW